MQPTRHTLRVPNLVAGDGYHRIAYEDWGDAMAPVTVVCVHGLTRNARDFDMLAAELAARGRRVLCLSMAGRGDSDWLANTADYNYGSYMADCLKVLDNFHLRQVDWVGTSMGGVIGMLIAAQHEGRIRKLVLNDIGVRLKKEALERIYRYVAAMPPRFEDRDSAERYLREVFAPFGIHELPVWEQFVAQSLRPHPQGGLRLACDPAIVEPMRRDTEDFTEIADVNLSEIWAQVFIPTLILRGESSDILDAETVSAMRATNPRAESAIIRGVGHAPSLMVPDQVKLVADWLMSANVKIAGI